jgi:hypothetical protein
VAILHGVRSNGLKEPRKAPPAAQALAQNHFTTFPLHRTESQMRNLLMTLVLCGVAQFASAAAECPAPAAASTDKRPAAELISSAAAQPPIATAAAQPAAMMVPASVHANPTQVMGGAPRGALAESSGEPRRGSRLAMVLAAVGVMLVIVLRRLGAST